MCSWKRFSIYSIIQKEKQQGNVLLGNCSPTSKGEFISIHYYVFYFHSFSCLIFYFIFKKRNKFILSFICCCTWLQSFSPHQSQSHIHFTIYLQPTCKSKKVISRFLYFTLHTSSPIDTTTTPILYTLAPAHNSRTRKRKLPLLICCLLDTSEPRVL
jgi:hypothetical protein